MTTEVLNKDKHPSVLISGGSGLIGRHLTSLLLNKGYSVSHLSRTGKSFPGVKVFSWDPSQQTIDSDALNGINYIVSLAGANIGEKRWTGKRKTEIEESRVNSTQFLFEMVKESSNSVKAFISASATGYYGSITSDKIFTEEDPAGSDFTGTICSKWEKSVKQFSEIGIRVAIIRTAVVLDTKEGALARLLLPARFGLIIRTGKGTQYLPWIHHKDLAEIYLHAIENNSISGSFNAAAPAHCTNDSFMRTLAEVTGRKVFLPPVPAFILNLFLGEMSKIVLEGSRVSSEKIISTGFRFNFPDLNGALRDVLNPGSNCG